MPIGRPVCTPVAFSTATSPETSRSCSRHLRALHQSQDGQGARSRNPGVIARPRRRGDRMRRRTFITFLGGATGWPFALSAQEPGLPVVALINGRSPEDAARNAAAFRKGLAENGYVEGQNVMLEYHWMKGQSQRLPSIMADLVRRRVAVIATPGFTAGALAAKAATTTIPIAFGVGDDPVKLGL